MSQPRTRPSILQPEEEKVDLFYHSQAPLTEQSTSSNLTKMEAIYLIQGTIPRLKYNLHQHQISVPMIAKLINRIIWDGMQELEPINMTKLSQERGSTSQQEKYRHLRLENQALLID